MHSSSFFVCLSAFFLAASTNASPIVRPFQARSSESDVAVRAASEGVQARGIASAVINAATELAADPTAIETAGSDLESLFSELQAREDDDDDDVEDDADNEDLVDVFARQELDDEDVLEDDDDEEDGLAVARRALKMRAALKLPKVKAAPKLTKPAKVTKPKAAPKVTKPKAAPKPAKPAQAVGGAPKKPTKTASKAAATSTAAAACGLRKKPSKGKRAPPPSTLTIKLNGADFSLRKSSSQGASSVVYQVVGGAHSGAFAKTPLTGNLDKEIANTQKVGQLIASGTDSNCDGDFSGRQWMVVKAAPGTPLEQNASFRTLKASGRDKCQAKADLIAELAFNKVQQVFTQTGVNQNDAHMGNVFFASSFDVNGLSESTVNSASNLAAVTLIDFGQANGSAPKKLIQLNSFKTSARALC